MVVKETVSHSKVPRTDSTPSMRLRGDSQNRLRESVDGKLLGRYIKGSRNLQLGQVSLKMETLTPGWCDWQVMGSGSHDLPIKKWVLPGSLQVIEILVIGQTHDAPASASPGAWISGMCHHALMKRHLCPSGWTCHSWLCNPRGDISRMSPSIK